MADTVIVAGKKISLDDGASTSIQDAVNSLPPFNAADPQAYFEALRAAVASSPDLFAQYVEAESGIEE